MGVSARSSLPHIPIGVTVISALIEHFICGRRADRPTFRDSHELLAKLSKALLSRKIIWFRVPITLIRVRLFTSKFNRIFLVSTHLSKPQKHYSNRHEVSFTMVAPVAPNPYFIVAPSLYRHSHVSLSRHLAFLFYPV